MFPPRNGKDIVAVSRDEELTGIYGWETLEIFVLVLSFGITDEQSLVLRGFLGVTVNFNYYLSYQKSFPLSAFQRSLKKTELSPDPCEEV